MSAPTLWEEGHWSGDRVTRLSVVACAVAVGLDLLVGSRITWVFDVLFVITCVGAALLVRHRDFFRVAVLPPLLLLAIALVLSGFDRTSVATAKDGYAQGVVSALADHSAALMIGYTLALAVLGVRHRVLTRLEGHSNRLASPAP